MAPDKTPMTPAVRALRQAGVAFTGHPYAYVEHGGTAAFAAEAGVDEHAVIKTLVMEDEAKTPFVVLMHGDREVSTKEMARVLGVKTARPCAPETAERHSGYQVGGTSPFGLRKPLPVYVEASIGPRPPSDARNGCRSVGSPVGDQVVADRTSSPGRPVDSHFRRLGLE
jgi:Cys-tRNA(Pro) deacylase